MARLLEGMDLKGKSVLDIGCGAGGVDVLLVGTYGAGYMRLVSTSRIRFWLMRASGP